MHRFVLAGNHSTDHWPKLEQDWDVNKKSSDLFDILVTKARQSVLKQVTKTSYIAHCKKTCKASSTHDRKEHKAIQTLSRYILHYTQCMIYGTSPKLFVQCNKSIRLLSRNFFFKLGFFQVGLGLWRIIFPWQSVILWWRYSWLGILFTNQLTFSVLLTAMFG